jgi:hypothetical protein
MSSWARVVGQVRQMIRTDGCASGGPMSFVRRSSIAGDVGSRLTSACSHFVMRHEIELHCKKIRLMGKLIEVKNILGR